MIPLHFLWTHSLHLEILMELLPTPLQPTAQGYLADFFRTSMSTLDTMNLIFFACHTSAPCLEFGDTHLLSVRAECQVIHIEQFQWYTSAELMRQYLEHQDEEQWAKDRALMHFEFHAKLLTVLTIDHTRSGHCGTCFAWHTQPIHPHPGPSCRTTGPFLVHDRWLSQVIHIEQFPWYTSSELMRQHLEHQDEEKWAKDRALTHFKFHAKLLTVLTIDHTRSGHCGTCFAWHTQPIHPHPGPHGAPQDLSWHMIDGFLKVDVQAKCLAWT